MEEIKFTILESYEIVVRESITPSELIKKNNLAIADDELLKMVDLDQAIEPTDYEMYLIETDKHVGLGLMPAYLHCALCKRGYRDATLFELLLCLDAHPDITGGKPVVVTGSIHKECFATSQCGGTGYREYVPVINRCGQLTILQLNRWGECKNHYILVVNKK